MKVGDIKLVEGCRPIVINDGDIMVINHNGRDCIAVMASEDLFYVCLGYENENEECVDGCVGYEDALRLPNKYEKVVGEYIASNNAQEIERLRASHIPHVEEDEIYIRENGSIIKLPILPYLHGKRCDFTFPIFHDDDHGRSLSGMFDGYMAVLTAMRDNESSSPYILSDEYVNEMIAQRERFGEASTQNMIKAFGNEDRKCLLVMRRDDKTFNEIGFTWDAKTNGMRVFVLAGDKMLMFHSRRLFEDESIKVKGITRYSHFLKDEEDTKKTFLGSAINVIYWFVCMENYAEIHVIDEFRSQTFSTVGEATNASIGFISKSDYIMRDATWYTSIWVDKEISVEGHRSHRWKRNTETGALYLAPVDVRSYTKNGYHRIAKIEK